MSQKLTHWYKIFPVDSLKISKYKKNLNIEKAKPSLEN